MKDSRGTGGPTSSISFPSSKPPWMTKRSTIRPTSPRYTSKEDDLDDSPEDDLDDSSNVQGWPWETGWQTKGWVRRVQWRWWSWWCWRGIRVTHLNDESHPGHNSPHGEPHSCPTRGLWPRPGTGCCWTRSSPPGRGSDSRWVGSPSGSQHWHTASSQKHLTRLSHQRLALFRSLRVNENTKHQRQISRTCVTLFEDLTTIQYLK